MEHAYARNPAFNQIINLPLYSLYHHDPENKMVYFDIVSLIPRLVSKMNSAARLKQLFGWERVSHQYATMRHDPEETYVVPKP